MISVSSAFQWAGDRISDAVFGDIQDRLRQGGEAIVAEAKALVPVRTGALRDSIGYRVEDRTLVVYAHQRYSLFVEFGTRTARPSPYLRPALAAAGRIFGGQIDMEFNALSSAPWQGIHAVGAGFVVPSGIQPRPLTQAQHRHVQEHLMPTSRRLHRGNVRRARMRVRRFD